MVDFIKRLKIYINTFHPDIDQSTITDTASESNASENLEELCGLNNDENVREWLRKVDRPDPDTWTEIDLDYSSPEEVCTVCFMVKTL